VWGYHQNNVNETCETAPTSGPWIAAQDFMPGSRHPTLRFSMRSVDVPEHDARNAPTNLK
jgi:hypothetical protein